MESRDDIELRSEKMRNIIGQVPPKLVRAGTAVIISIIIIIALAAWLIKIDGQSIVRIVFP